MFPGIIIKKLHYRAVERSVNMQLLTLAPFTYPIDNRRFFFIGYSQGYYYTCAAARPRLTELGRKPGGGNNNPTECLQVIHDILSSTIPEIEAGREHVDRAGDAYWSDNHAADRFCASFWQPMNPSFLRSKFRSKT